MNERRRFLEVLGGSVVVLCAGCGSEAPGAPAGAGGAGGAGGTGGVAGTGGGAGAGGGASVTSSSAGSASATSTSASSSTSTAASSTAASSSSSSGGCGTTPVGTKLGAPTDYAALGLHILAGRSVLIGRDAEGLYALTAICTHQGCNMDGNSLGTILETGGQNVGITCNCHGSRFANDGSVTAGPASSPLKAFELALGCDGFLYVNTAKTVPSTTRLTVT